MASTNLSQKSHPRFTGAARRSRMINLTFTIRFPCRDTGSTNPVILIGLSFASDTFGNGPYLNLSTPGGKYEARIKLGPAPVSSTESFLVIIVLP